MDLLTSAGDTRDVQKVVEEGEVELKVEPELWRGENATKEDEEEEDKEVHFSLRVCLCGVSVRVCLDG